MLRQYIFLKKLWYYIGVWGGGKGGGWVLQDDLMLSTELMMYIIAIIPVSKADVSSASP